MKPTRKEYTEWLNELPVPFEDCRSNGGRIPDNAKLGDWTRRHDPIAFNVGFQEWTREQEFAAAKAACRVPSIVTMHDVTKMCAPRGEAAQDSFDRDLGMASDDGGDDY